MDDEDARSFGRPDLDSLHLVESGGSAIRLHADRPGWRDGYIIYVDWFAA